MATQNYTLRDQVNGVPFNYGTSAEDIKREQRIADALNSWKLEGKVNGWQVLAKALTSYMAGKRMYDAGEAQKDLDSRSRDEYNKAWDMFTTPSESEKSALEDPYIYKHVDPNSVGPTMDQLNGVNASGVPSSNVQGTPLAPVGNQPTRAQLERAAGEAVLAGAGKPTAQQIERAVVPDTSAAPVGVMGKPIVPPQALPASVTTPQRALPSATAAQMPPPAQPPANVGPAPTPAPQATPNPVPARAPLAGALNAQEMAMLRGAGLNAQDVGPDFMADRGSARQALAGAMQAEAQRKRGAMDALYNSGPRGEKEYNALRAAQLAKLVKDKDADEYTTTSLGDGRFVTTNKRTGQVVSGDSTGGTETLKPSEKVSVMKAHSDDTKELGKINTGINTLNKGLTELDGVRKNLGDVGTGPWVSVLNTLATKAPGEYGSKVKAVRAYFKSAAFQNARSTLATNISDADMKGFFATTPDDSWGDAQLVDYLDKFETATRAQLNTDRETAGRYSSNIGEYNKMLGRSENSSSPSQGAAPATINGVPRYQRGTTLRPGV